MASPRTSAPAHPLRLLVAAGLVTAATVSVLPAGIGHADPAPTIQQVEQRVDELNLRVDTAVEDYDQAQIALTAAQRASAAAQVRVARAQAELDAHQQEMGVMLASTYRSGGNDQLASLVATSDPQQFLDRASSLDRIARSQSDQLAEVTTARTRLAEAKVAAQAELDAQKAQTERMASRKTEIEKTLQEQQALLANLKEEERRRLEAARQARLAAERRAAAAAQAQEKARLAAEARASRKRPTVTSTQAAPSTSTSTPSAAEPDSSSAAPVGASSGRASAAVAAAYSRLGSPYVWGASGPSTFDCSGLTMWAWARGGVSLPHSSQAQYSSGRHVSQSEIQPGDLVFYGSPIHHVGIYVGGGQMISAPHTGTVVKVQSAFRSDYVGAVRP